MDEPVKSQRVRLFDVYVLGPSMTVAGYQLARRGSPLLGGFIALMGVGTTLYNADNWQKIDARR